MENNIKKFNRRVTKQTESIIYYHFVFCTRYRRKIFINEELNKRFKTLVNEIAEDNDIEVLEIYTHLEYCYLSVEAPPSISPKNIMAKLKSETSRILREEFKELSAIPSLWTRNYFVSTAGNVSSETIKQYVENQRKR